MMSRDCSKPGLDMTAFALGDLAGEERREVEEHLAGCPLCRREAEALRNVVERARDLPRLAVSSGYQARLLARVRQEIRRTRESDQPAGVSLSLGDRLVLNSGFVFYTLRRSVFARALLSAAALLVAALMLIGVFSRAAEQTAAPDSGDSTSAGTSAGSGGAAGVKDEDWPRLLPEETGREVTGLGIDKLEDPSEDFPAPEVNEPEMSEVSLIPVEDIGTRLERENLLELGRYRMFARHNPRCKTSVMEGRGGDAKTVYTVDRGLRWLRYHQEEDGSWDPERFSGDPGSEFGGDPRARVGLTALAVAAFLSDGHTQSAGRYRDTVSSGINFILASRDSLGRFGEVAGNPTISIFNQSVCVLVLAENYILSGGANEDELRLGTSRLLSMTRAVTSDPEHGTYGDTWAAMALRTVLMTGLDEDAVAQVSRDVEARVALLAREETAGPGVHVTVPPVYSASIEAVDALFTHDESPAAKNGEGAAPYPDRHRPETMFTLLDDPALREPSFLFFIGTALCEETSPFWPEWNERVKSILLQEQDREGFWPAGGDWPTIDGGDIYTTALSILTLQVYYRFIKLEVNCP